MATAQETGLSFHEVGIAEALHRWSLSVPLNQRSYNWDEQVPQLFDDLFKAFDSGDAIYFLGAIVLTRGAKGELQVSDGQQRLATTCIAVAAARDYLLELGDVESANTYENKYLTNYVPKKSAYEAKLILNYEDKEFFSTQVLTPHKTRSRFTGRHFGSHDRLIAAFASATEFVRRITEPYRSNEEKKSRLYDWIEFLHSAAK